MTSFDDEVRIRQLQALLGAFGTRPPIVAGVVNADGSIARGEGFTITKGAAGIYTINFSTAFSAVPAVNPTPLHATVALDAQLLSKTVSAVQIYLRTPANVGTDAVFDFIAVGPT